MSGRADGRDFDELRPVSITRGYTEMTPGSVLIEMGKTRVLCTAAADPGVPRWLKDTGKGWVTAEYNMLPGSSRERISRNSLNGGRTKEIQRLIGRSLRAIVDLQAMGELSVRVDCDVLQADGGTRTASITGAWIALHDALAAARADGLVETDPLLDHCAAVSVGVREGAILLDLDYPEDVSVDVDFNVVMTGEGRLIEVQGTAEHAPFTRDDLTGLVDAAAAGIEHLVELQRKAVAG
ncbi:MAG: ribonuclease PH [Acidimicrobiia bacterium]|nr:ribonuclease PH [Acidimicrobiia bacterium]MBT8217615.1 ribonuclease PH [Acidimicrobiia bacterium]NNF09328.1 ribonuclease PH [Acidimicrobiia bacterium]NNL70352.1 ribonuclease PH [Acidimicrobiia bacterium]